MPGSSSQCPHGLPPSRSTLRRLLALTVAAVTALTIGVASPSPASARPQAQRLFTTMTQNLYLGANLQPLFTAQDLVAAANAAYNHMVQVDFPARAQAIAREIEAQAPVALGLQEVALWSQGSSPATLQPTYDYLAILLQALADRGLRYRTAVVNVNFSGALPLAYDFSLWGGFTDRDAILVRADLPVSELKVSNPISRNFQAKLQVTIGGQPVLVPRGWSSIDVKFGGKGYRFADTHLEAYSEQIRNLQGAELVTELSSSPLPVVLVGDINSPPTDATGPYGMLAAAGFVDSWTEAMGTDPGFTSGQPDDLDCSLPSTIDHRIDYVLHDSPGIADAVTGSGVVVGEEASDCTTGTTPPLWPSDHAGVAMTLHLAKP
jgi:endonuclease/exonuclease/phosphatase family metal-dependent hydrolase